MSSADNPPAWRRILRTGRATVDGFMADDPFQMAAALGYFTMLSMAPLLLVVTGAAGLLLDSAAVQEALLAQVRELAGEQGADLLRTVMANASTADGGLLAVLTGAGLTLLGATTVFAQLQWALNRVFAATPPKGGAVAFLKARLTAFAVVLGLGFVLLVSLFLSALVSGAGDLLAGWLPGADLVVQALNILLSLAVIALFMALLFRYVPDRRLAWRPVWIGALVTAVLFSVGKYLIGLYLGEAGVGSAYGAAGSVIVLMVWVYYASLILFVGAELTWVLVEQAEQAGQAEQAEPAAQSGPATPPEQGDAGGS